MFKIMTDFEKCQVLLGNFYGDANYQRHPKYKNATYIYSKHSNAQREYVEFLEYIYKEMGVYQFSNYDKFNKGGYLNGNLCSYVAAKPPIIDFYQTPDFTNSKNKRIITENGLMQLSLYGLILWFMDDGSLCVYKNSKGSKRHARLSTQRYSYEEHEIIQKVFKNKWDLDVKIYGQHHKQLNGKFLNYIYFNCTNFKKLFILAEEYIRWWIPSSMTYKFHMQYDDPRKSFYNLF